MNWKQLKDFCNSLPESELDKRVILWREDECISEIKAEQLEENYYVDEQITNEGCIPESDAKTYVSEDKKSFPNGMDDLKKVYDKGTPILWEEF